MFVAGPLAAQFSEAATPRASDDEVDWFDARIPRQAGMSLCLLCGTGALLLPLAERGIGVHGVEQSSAMASVCESKARAAGTPISVIRQDPANLNLPFRYAAALCAAGEFQRLSDPLAAAEALRRIRAHLVAPAVLLLDLFMPAAAQNPPGAPLVEVRSVDLPSGARIALRSETTIDCDGRRLERRNRYELRDGPRLIGREDELLALTWHTRDEAAELVSAAGFVDVRIEPSPRPAGRDQGFAITARARS